MPIPGFHQVKLFQNPGAGGTDAFSLFTGMSGGLSRPPKAGSGRELPGATGDDPSPVSKPKAAGAGNTGFERFLAVHRGSRGGRTLSGGDSKSGAVYTEGKYKGMTQGQGDVKAHGQFQGMSEGARENYRQMNEADYAAAREREIQAARDQFALAREFQAQIRADIRKEEEGNKPPVDNPGAGTFDPDSPGGKKPSDKTPAKPGIDTRYADHEGTINGEPANNAIEKARRAAEAGLQNAAVDANNAGFMQSQYGGGQKAAAKPQGGLRTGGLRTGGLRTGGLTSGREAAAARQKKKRKGTPVANA